MTGQRALQTRRYQIEWMLLGTVLLILGALTGYWLYTERNRVEARERDRLQTQARVIDENLGRQLEGVNNALASVRNDFPPSDSENIGPTISRRLKILSDAMPGVRTMLIFDAKGTVLASSRDELIGMNFRQREYFKVPRERPDPATLYVSPPFKTVLGVFSINVVRVVTGSRGEFAGIVSATLDPEYFSVLLRSVLYAPDMRTSIAHGDGQVFLFMPPHDKALGMNLERPGSFRNRHLETGQIATVMTGNVYATGEERMMAQRIVNPAGLHMDKHLGIAVSRDLAALYAAWRRDVFLNSGFYGAFALTAILSLYFFQRRRRTFDRLTAVQENEQRKGAERLELALRGGELGLWDCHLPSGKLICNERWSAMLGYDLDEIVPDVGSWRKRVHPDDWPAIHAALDPHLKGETPAYESEHRLRHKDGHWVWILDRGKVMERDAAGAPVRMVGTHLDVTERKKMELALRASEEKYRGIYDSLQDLYVETDLDGTILDIGPHVEELSGGLYKREDLLGRSAQAFYADPERRAALLRTLTLLGSVKDFESTFLNRDGTAVPFSISATIRPDAEGRPRRIVSMARDITARKRAEASLRESEERLRAIFEGALDGILVMDVGSGKFLIGNPAICRMLGYTLQEIVRLGISDIHPKQDLARVVEEFNRLQRGEIQDVPDFPVIRKDGSTFHADMQLALIRLGGKDCALAIIRDITERRRAEQELKRIAAELRQAYRRLAQAQEAERLALTKELHDQVGQNLSALNLNLHYIDRELSDAERARLKGRLDDCLVLLDETVARVRGVMGNLRPPMLDEFGLFATLRWWAHETTQRSGIPCMLAGPDLAQRLPAEMESALLRIAQEALMNAAKYSKANEIRIALTATPRQVQMKIADDGVGFDPFARNANDAKPTWGLTTMRERADALGGKVQVITAPGKGTRVVAEIPRA